MTDEILLERADGVLTITLNRPAKKNALTGDMYGALTEALLAGDADPDVRVILIKAAGDAFVAGADIARFAAINAGEITGPPAGQPFLQALAAARTPVVAAVHGRAVGVGFTMLLHCDLVYVAEDALLSCPFINLALTPEAASSILLPARIGHIRAFRLFALGEAIAGRTAVDWGLATEALPAAEVQARGWEAAAALARRPADALRVMKGLMVDGQAVRQRIDLEFELFYQRLASAEAREAFAAFFEKRPPDFRRC